MDRDEYYGNPKMKIDFPHSQFYFYINKVGNLVGLLNNDPEFMKKVHGVGEFGDYICFSSSKDIFVI